VKAIAGNTMRKLSAAVSSLVLPLLATAALAAAGSYGISLFGELKYGPDFKNFEYANPNAPKGGTMKFSAIGTYDTLNPYVVKGVPAAGIGQIFDTLLIGSQDEPGSEYGLVAETVEIAPDKLSVLYTMRKEARFHDGSPMTPEDLVWTFETLRQKGHPMYRSYYGDVTKVEQEGDRGVRFHFKDANNRELPQILGQMPVLSKAYWSNRDFAKTTLEPPLGSGAYKVDALDAGRSITYKRVPDYWAANLPVNKGRSNVDVIRYDYYRDGTIALEAFKAGQYDVRRENSSKSWATGYDSPAMREGLIKKEQIKNELPSGMQGFGYNLRRPLFQDPKVRQALGYGFDFEWSNKNLFYGLYARTRSYFDNSELAATGAPKGEELKILEPFRGKIPDEVFTKEYNPPKYDGSGNIRDGLREALKLLKEAGWSFKNEKLVNDKTGQPFDFDIIIGVWGESLSPGNEQREFWGSQAADAPGSRNLIGIKNPAIDALIEKVIFAKDRETLVATTRALDRVLLWNFYVVPQFTYGFARYARWDRFSHAELPKYARSGLPSLWWYDAEKAARLGKRS